MKGENKVLLFWVWAGMELCYLYACANFVTTAIFHRAFPFPEAIGSFLAAALLTLFSGGRGWRVIYVLGVQLFGLIPAVIRIGGIFTSWSDAFAAQSWFTESLGSPADAAPYFVTFLVVGWFFAFWVGGIEHVGRSRDYATICSRFDRGLTAFLMLFLAKFYFQAVQNIQVDDSLSGQFIIPFLIFGLLAIGLVRNQGDTPKGFLPGYRTIGVMLGFIVVILLVGTGLVFFFLPYLTSAAATGVGILDQVSRPVISIVAGILTWLFPPDVTISEEPSVKKEPLPSDASPWIFPWWLELIGRVLSVVVAILLVIVVLAILGGLLYSIVLWLFSKTSADQDKPSLRQTFSSFMARLWSFLLFLGTNMTRRAPGYRGAVRLYGALCAWGRASGLPRLPSETPIEFGLRLSDRFPLLASEIESIVSAFNLEFYGQVALDDHHLTTPQSALRRLSSPTLWPMRFKTWFFRQVPGSGE